MDDDEDACFLMTSMLRQRGFAVSSVSNAAACLERLAADRPAIVVTDVQMPGMSGVELCRVLREQYPEVVAVVVSGIATPRMIEEAAAAGAFTFLPKPVSVNALEATLARASETRQAG